MLASTTSQAEQILFDRARRLLSEDDVQLLKQTIEEVWCFVGVMLYLWNVCGFIHQPDKQLMNTLLN